MSSSDHPLTAAARGLSLNASKTITLSGTPEFAEVAYDVNKQILAMATLVAPAFEANPEDKRAPIDVCCVIDRSGSMEGEKLALVKKALLFVVDNMDAGDSLSIVTYETEVETLFDFKVMDAEGKKAAKLLIPKIRVKDMTNLCGGLLRGLELSKNRKQPKDVCSVLLFTDGLANQGITETSKITAEMEKQLVDFPKKPSVFTFGFGADHNQDMLRSIAEAGGGMYYYLSDADKIPLSFADCLGGLQSVVGQNLLLSVEAPAGTTIVKLLNIKYKITKGDLPGNKFTLELGDIYSEEERDIILLVDVPTLGAPIEDYTVAKFDLNYFNTLLTHDEDLSTLVKMKRPGQVSADIKPNVALDKQRNRLEAAEAMEVAKKKADTGDLEGAKAILQNSKQQIESSASATDTFCQNLSKELDQCIVDMSDRAHYMSQGNKHITRKAQAHYYQRSNKIEEKEIDFYETSSKFKSKASSGF